MSTPLPDQLRLHSVFDYSPITGDLLWRPDYFRRQQNAGYMKLTGKKDCGHVRIKFEGRCFYAHRLIWMWMTGTDPGNSVVDHINGFAMDNRWSNLRLLSLSDNSRYAAIRRKFWRDLNNGHYSQYQYEQQSLL